MSQFEIAKGKSERRYQTDGDDNATLQGDTEGVEFSIATYVDIDDGLLSQYRNIDEVEGLVLDALRQASKKLPLSFVLTVRPGEDVDDVELVPW